MLEILDHRETEKGVLTLQKRKDRTLNQDVFEIKLNDEFLMTSAFVQSEEELARHALATLDRDNLKVLIGGLGLGYTACAALENDSVGSVIVVEALAPVIEWHQGAILPLGARLFRDPRCSVVNEDFFTFIGEAHGREAVKAEQLYDAILIDIDHSPAAVLNADHAWFYEVSGLQSINHHLVPGGVVAIWSNEPPDQEFIDRLETAVGQARAEPVTFINPYQQNEVVQTVYLATASGQE